MTTSENARSRSAETSASAVSPETLAYGDQPTTSSVNSVPRSTVSLPTSASSAFIITSLRDSPIATRLFRGAAARNPLCGGWSDPEGLRLGRRELLVGQDAGGVQLREMFQLV